MKKDFEKVKKTAFKKLCGFFCLLQAIIIEFSYSKVIRPRLQGSMMLRVTTMEILKLTYWDPARDMKSVLTVSTLRGCGSDLLIQLPCLLYYLYCGSFKTFKDANMSFFSQDPEHLNLVLIIR